jgi:hypothetical protein
MSVLNRTYAVDSTLIATTGTSAYAALYIAPTSTNDLVICRIKVQVEATSSQSASPSTNNSILFQLSTVTGSKAGGGAVTPKQISGTTLAANTVFSSAASAAITGLTQTTEYWQNTIALSAGSWAEDAYENTGLEIPLAASSLSCFYFTTASGAGSNLSARITVTFVE